MGDEKTMRLLLGRKRMPVLKYFQLPPAGLFLVAAILHRHLVLITLVPSPSKKTLFQNTETIS
jgi:hypothetical protein